MLVERESPILLAVCRRILADPDEAEDAAQDAFLIAYRKLATFRGDGPLGGWLMRIAIREARDRALRRPNATTLPDEDEFGRPSLRAPAIDDPANAFDRSERDAWLRAAIDELPPHYRDAVRRRYLDEESYEEIAVATGRSPATVRTHLHRGLARLRERLTTETPT